MNLVETYLSKTNATTQSGPNAERFINRELSWLDFNRRVLHQTMRSEVPLWERLKFLSITSSNLDEFIAVRLASTMNRMLNTEAKVEISGLTATQEYRRLLPEIKEFKKMQEEAFMILEQKTRKKGFHFSTIGQLSKKELQSLRRLFMRQIFPLLTPIAIDSTKELPLLRSKQLAISVMLKEPSNENIEVLAIVPISNGLDSIYELKGEKERLHYLRVEDIVEHFLSVLFVNKIIKQSMVFRLIREADMELDSNKDVYIVERMLKTLQDREHGRPIFIDYRGTQCKPLIKELQHLFDITPHHHHRFKQLVDFSIFMRMQNPLGKDNEYVPFEPHFPADLDSDPDMFRAISRSDMLLHHPYESFGPVINFLEQAADDPDVLVIRQTLYRVSSADSPVVNALCRAAQQGKDVAVLLEIKARFDEERNIGLVDKLQSAGVTIVYGVEKLKTHCKFILVARREGKAIRIYSHIGTGNYNDKTARVYTDVSYFTANNKMGEDLITVFNILTGYSDPNEKINKVFYSPFNIRTRLEKLIQNEIDNAKAGKFAEVVFKLNSLSDKNIIHNLYRASEAGVKVVIIVRGICSMRAINENITIMSVVGRFLEHSRIYSFSNDGEQDVYISSADLLTRNLDRRIEIMVRITEMNAKHKLINILNDTAMDQFNCYDMNQKGQFTKFELPSKDVPLIDAHRMFMVAP